MELPNKFKVQVFLHYNEKDGQYNIPYDGRPLLGMPATFRSKEALDKNKKNIETKDNFNELFMQEIKDKVIY